MKLTGLAAELYDEMLKIPVIDCHEHLPTETERLKQKYDVTRLFSHYCTANLAGAGLPAGKAQTEVFDCTKPLLPRWQRLKPAFERIRFGSYAYPALAYVRDILGFDDIGDATVEAISEKMKAEQTPGFYRRAMVDRCGIETAIQCVDTVREGDQNFFAYLCRDRANGDPLTGLEQETGRTLATLDACVEALRQYVADQKRRGAVGYKVGAAYHRTLEYTNVARADAERIFARLRAKVRASVSDRDMELLENYLLRRAVEACIDENLVVVIHTGYQAGLHNDIRNARATLLWGLLRDYPQARFDLFHGSFPYVEDMTVLGKYFENVALNMCWMHIMSPEISRRALAQWLDAVPAHKIFAFGGDYSIVENVYGHLKLARADVAMVLAEKVEQGWCSEPQALDLARMLFYDNPKAWYVL